MTLDLQRQREQAHALLDQLPPAKLGAVRSLLEVMVEDDEPVSEEDRRRFHQGQAVFAGGRGIPMEDVLAEFGVRPEDFPQNK